VPRRPVQLSAVLPLLARHAAWRLTGSEAAGRGVVRALSSADPTTRTMAGMLLVRAGDRSRPLLREALAARRALPMVLPILADIGDHESRPALSALTRDPDPAVAGAAREAMRVLDARSGRAGG
jgi:hypothetical protein